MGRIIDLTKELGDYNSFDSMGIRDMLLAGVKPDFKVYTAGMQSVFNEDGLPTNLVRMVGSSTEEDLQGDTMDILALKDMTQVPENLTVWLNHSYDLPDDVFGSVYETPIIVQRNGIADLHIVADVEMLNPRAAKVKQYIDNGRRLGCSIGCIVTKYELPDEETDGPEYYKLPIRILGVITLEYSIVGIPANQRSWVENAVRGLFTRTLDPRLAPAMKNLWPSAYRKALEEAPDMQRKALEKTLERPAKKRRIEWEPETHLFLFHAGKSKLSMTEDALKFHGVASMKAMDETEVEDMVLLYEPETVKGACGSTSWPLADKGHSWDGGEAKKRLNKWAGEDKGKLKRVYFWTDGEDHFKLPFCDVINGSIKAVPAAIHAVAGSLGGSRSGLNVPEADKQAIRRKVAAYYRKMGETPPWENDDDKSVHDEVYMTEEGEILAMTAKKRFAVNTDGSQGVELLNAAGDHDIFNGTHTHVHKAFGGPDSGMDDQHEHDHVHVNDAAHMHNHIVAPATPGGEQDANRDGDGDVDTNGSQGGPGHGDDSGLPSQTRPGTALAANVALVKELDPWQKSILEAVNGLLKQLELPDLTAEHVTQKSFVTKAVGDTAQDHPVHLQTIHDSVVSHAMTHHNMMLCGATSGSQAQSDMNFDGARQQAELSDGTDAAGRRMSGDVLVSLTKALEGFNVQAATQDVRVLGAALEVLKGEVAKLSQEYTQAQQTLAALKEMPLGNPTHLSRTVVTDEGRVTHDDLAGIINSQKSLPTTAGTPVELIEKGTKVEERISGTTRMTVRVWPEDFGGDVHKGWRPLLSSDQIMFMTWDMIERYNAGKEAEVPFIDDPVVALKN